MKIKSLFAGSLLLIGFAACQTQNDKTDTGITYKVYSNGGTEKVDSGSLVSVNYILTLERPGHTDSMLANTAVMGGPERILMKKPSKEENDIVSKTMREVIYKMSKGDSAIFTIPVDSIDEKIKANMDFLKQGGSLKWNLTIAEILSKEAFHDKQKEAQVQLEEYLVKIKQDNAEQAVKDSIIITDYAKKNNLNGTMLPSGLYYVITKEGEGAFPMPNELATVDYKGYLVNGTVFDNSFERGQPIEVPLGMGRVIPGWDQGLLYFKKGSEGKLLIPSYLAYGKQGNERIPENSVLIFDIKMVDIK